MFTIKNHLEVQNNHLIIGGADTTELAEKFGTPLYVTNESRIVENFSAYRRAFPDADIYYAAKANGSLAILRILARQGAGADVFSFGELYMALLAGIPHDKILFNGNSKTDFELQKATELGVRVSVDSLDELHTLSEIAQRSGKTVEIAFRVNPDVSPDTHPKISTGLRTSKFGIPAEEVVNTYREASDLPGIAPCGIHCHIGSQILDTEPFIEATEKMMDLVEQVMRTGIDLKFVDIGSGLGIPYKKGERTPQPQDLASVVLPIFNERTQALGISPKLILEPGRYIIGDTTVLLTRVNTVKKAARNFVGVDAGFNLLIRPAMYDSYHHVLVANKAASPPEGVYTVVGPICETGDVLARDRELPNVEKGDIVALLDAGAYGFSMSSQYNGRPRCAEVLVKDGIVDIIRSREDIEDLVAKQRIPARLM
ncbi:diaminopimelate decarboxylase [Candidatus Methanoperedens nitroreducens]|uniref:Diaminopimelate decarboxylase n=1 Tax=Candidatus Methanoperedens nitratireducens TaxID=1392998 RepID=A0A062V8L6_9EURY|nr:diaminopimelate decarboxylase [Candidatus Methanoperedens nitroreducens]KCZ71715.1 diaminopimelate decarboxylase [Candidatus Methanoperedens nitroreducens]MDJ1422312.1 diaminopimelate decarboxylase [Candidatus Methanoperedens sp.]